MHLPGTQENVSVKHTELRAIDSLFLSLSFSFVLVQSRKKNRGTMGGVCRSQDSPEKENQ